MVTTPGQSGDFVRELHPFRATHEAHSCVDECPSRALIVTRVGTCSDTHPSVRHSGHAASANALAPALRPRRTIQKIAAASRSTTNVATAGPRARSSASCARRPEEVAEQEVQLEEHARADGKRGYCPSRVQPRRAGCDHGHRANARRGPADCQCRPAAALDGRARTIEPLVGEPDPRTEARKHGTARPARSGTMWPSPPAPRPRARHRGPSGKRTVGDSLTDQQHQQIGRHRDRNARFHRQEQSQRGRNSQAGARGPGRCRQEPHRDACRSCRRTSRSPLRSHRRPVGDASP